MFTRILSLIVAGIALGVSGAQIEFDFSKDMVDKVPPGFVSRISGTGKPAEWKVLDQEVPPLLAPLESNAPIHTAKRAVLGVQSYNLDENHFPLLLYTNEIFSDFTMTTRFKISGGVVEPSAGLAFRVQDPSNYYVLRASTEGNLLWYKVVGGVAHPELGIGVKMPLARDVWRELKVECTGNQIRCFLDGRLVIPPSRKGAPTDTLAINDTTFQRGMVGFWSKADSKISFVDATVQYTPHVPYVQIVINNMAKKHPAILDLKVYAVKNGGLPSVIGCMNERDAGTPGTKTEADVMERASVYYLKQDKTVEVTMPLRDRNGDVVAAVKIKMKSFRGETQSTAVTKATLWKKEIEVQVETMQDING